MKYRVKITHCAPIIDNILGANYPYYCKDDKDLLIEVNSEEEASTIDLIEKHQVLTFQYVEQLQKLIEDRDHD